MPRVMTSSDPRSYVECAVCGDRMRNLDAHMRAAHSLTTREYQRRFNQPVICDDLSAHWRACLEDRHGRVAYWSDPERGKDRIAAALRRASVDGMAPSSHDWQQRPRPSIKGGAWRGVTLGHPMYPTVVRVFGSWGAAVAHAGLVPQTRRKPLSRPRRLKSHCKRGHKFTASNTRWDKNGVRHCRRCHADRARDYNRHVRNLALATE